MTNLQLANPQFRLCLRKLSQVAPRVRVLRNKCRQVQRDVIWRELRGEVRGGGLEFGRVRLFDVLVGDEAVLVRDAERVQKRCSSSAADGTSGS